MKAAGVVHMPGLADETLRDLAPFLAEEGIDLNDPGDVSLDALNEALSRATSRYNDSLQGPPSGVRNITSAPSYSKSKSKRGKNVSGHPGRREADRTDRVLVRDFGRWLHQQDEIAAPSVREETDVFEEILKAARRLGYNPHVPVDVEELVYGFADAYDPESDGMAEATIATLHDYIHFRMESGDPEEWADAHGAVEEVIDEFLVEDNILVDAYLEADQIAPELRRAAFAETPIVSRVTELLEWIGEGRKTAPSGGFRRVDIKYGASLLGIAAQGVSKLPSVPPYPRPLFDPNDEDAGTIYVQSMKDVPLLPSWLDALRAARIIESNSYRVTPGPAADDWLAEELPPLELAEMVIGFTAAYFMSEDHGRRSFEEQTTARTITHLIQALTPEQDTLSRYVSELERLLDNASRRKLEYLVRVGLLTKEDSGDFVVPEKLRGAVAKGVLTGLSIMSLEYEEEPDSDE